MFRSLSCYNVSYRLSLSYCCSESNPSGSNEDNRRVKSQQHISEGRRVRKRLGLQRPINPPRGSLRRHHPPRRAHLRSGLLSLPATSQHIHYYCLPFHRLELPVDSSPSPPFFLLPPTPNQRYGTTLESQEHRHQLHHGSAREAYRVH